MPPRASKGRGAREQSRNERRSEYAELVIPSLIDRIDQLTPTDRVLIVGDDLEPLVATLAPQVANIAFLASEFERWDAARTALAEFSNVVVVQELEELDDPDGFDLEPWTYGIMLLPYHLGTREMNGTIGEFVDRLAPNAPIVAAGSRHHEWSMAQERIGALFGPLTTLYNSDPVRVVRGLVRPRGGFESGQRA